MSICFTEIVTALVRTGKWRGAGKSLEQCFIELRPGGKIFTMLKNHYLLVPLIIDYPLQM